MTDLQLIDGDLTLRGGELVAVPSEVQHQLDLLRFDKGHNVFAPTTGVGVINYVNSPGDIAQVGGICRGEFSRDGLPQPKQVQISGHTITLIP